MAAKNNTAAFPRGIADVDPLKGPLRIREAEQRIGMLEDKIASGLTRGTAMCDQFRQAFPNAPAMLVRYRDRTLTFYRWRRSSAKRWAGGPAAKDNPSITLTSAAGQAILAKLPETARAAFLVYEKRRLYINLQLSTLTYELHRLQQWIKALDEVRAVEQTGIDTAPAARPVGG